LVVAIVVLASIVGDNLGYWAARNGGRPLLERHRLTRSAKDVLEGEAIAAVRLPGTRPRRSS
jgi:membrane protein DedA with SNARE-associated domain